MYALTTENMNKSGRLTTELYQKNDWWDNRTWKELVFLLASQVNRKLADYHNPQVHDFS
jgi:hypothetical protein